MRIPISNFRGQIRKLGKGNKWQTVYAQAKQMACISLFMNTYNFTDIQLEFLNVLSFYNSLYTDIAMGDAPECVLNNEIYEEAYSLYKSEERIVRRKKDPTKPQTVNISTNKQEISEKDQFVFRTGR